MNDRYNDYKNTYRDFDGRTQSMSEWAKEFGVPPATLERYRVGCGWRAACLYYSKKKGKKENRKFSKDCERCHRCEWYDTDNNLCAYCSLTGHTRGKVVDGHMQYEPVDKCSKWKARSGVRHTQNGYGSIYAFLTDEDDDNG